MDHGPGGALAERVKVGRVRVGVVEEQEHEGEGQARARRGHRPEPLPAALSALPPLSRSPSAPPGRARSRPPVRRRAARGVGVLRSLYPSAVNMGRSIVVIVTVTQVQEVTAVLEHSGTSAYTQPAEYRGDEVVVAPHRPGLRGAWGEVLLVVEEEDGHEVDEEEEVQPQP